VFLFCFSLFMFSLLEANSRSEFKFFLMFCSFGNRNEKKFHSWAVTCVREVANRWYGRFLWKWGFSPHMLWICDEPIKGKDRVHLFQSNIISCIPRTSWSRRMRPGGKPNEHDNAQQSWIIPTLRKPSLKRRMHTNCAQRHNYEDKLENRRPTYKRAHNNSKKKA
jgi:hypothetical protein